MPEERAMLFFDDPAVQRSERPLTLLEIKTEPAVPLWVRNLVERFELFQRGHSKYCYALDRLQELPLERTASRTVIGG